MNDSILLLKTLIASTLAVLAYLLGGFDILLQGLVVMVALDIITGVIMAISNKTLSSEVSFRGMARKVMIFALVAVAKIADDLTGTDNLFRNSTAYFYAGSEGLSILENAVAMGLPVPPGLREALAKFQKRDH